MVFAGNQELIYLYEMTEKFRNKYRVRSARMQNWDYGSNGAYFITICTQNRVHFFGEIENGKMVLTEIGKQAESCFHEIPIHFTFAELGNFVVMPNHVHAIIIINKPGNSVVENGDEYGDEYGNVTGINPVETRLIASLPITKPTPETNSTQSFESSNFGGFSGLKNPMFQNNLPRIIRWYKGRTTFESRKIHNGFAWQPRYYDHIIRNSATFHRIDNYITINPLNWNKDGFNK